MEYPLGGKMKKKPKRVGSAPSVSKILPIFEL